MPQWGIATIANGGKIDGTGYGSKIHDSYGPECGQALWINDPITPLEYKLLKADDRNDWKSPPISKTNTEIRITNKLNRSIDLVWMNFKGEPVVYYKNVQAGANIK